MEIALLAFCPATRRFGIAAASSRYAALGTRLAALPWRGLVHAAGERLPSPLQAEAALGEGWRGEALLARLGEAEGAERVLCTIDAQGRFAIRAGASAQRSLYRASRQHAHAMTLGHGSAATAFALVDTFAQGEGESFAERLLRGLEAGARTCGLPAESAFLRVYDPAIEYAYTDVTVDLHEEALAQLRRAHDWLSPLYDYYALRGYDPTIARYPQWLAAQGIQRA